MIKLINFLQTKVTNVPTNYGLYHILCIALIIGLTVFLCVKYKNCDEKTFRKITLISWIVILLLEVYKQIIFSIHVTNNEMVVEYSWYAFPFQLCSTPLYVLPFIIFMKDCKIRDCFISFMSIFSLFGGLIVYIYPNDVFHSFIGINIQTMVHHGLQIVLGIYFVIYKRKNFSFKNLFYGLVIYVIACMIALLLNEIIFAIFNSQKIDQTFNMFYISRHYKNHLPILCDIQANFPYVVFLLAYIFGSIIAGCIITSAYVGFIKIFKVNKKEI